ncbi:MAG: TPM domain-containing protein, partial [Clostridia bacterium]|nr:TPM domain-containing protein [Clostridia bacterium]
MAKLKPAVLNIITAAAILLLLLPFVSDVVNNYKNRAASESLEYDPGDIVIYDFAGLLTSEETEKLAKDMAPVAAFYPVAFVSTDDNNGYGTASYAKAAFEVIFPEGKGILFLIDMDDRYLYIYTSDDNTKLSVSKCETVTDNVFRYATAGDYYTCASSAFEQIYRIQSGLAVPQPMKHMSNAMIALCIALFGMFVSSNDITKIKTPGEVYQLDKNTKRQKDINDMRMTLVRTYSYSNKSSSGGGGGG